MRYLFAALITIGFSVMLFSQVDIPESAKAKYALRQLNPFEWMYDTIYIDESSTIVDSVKWNALYLTRNSTIDGRMALHHPRLLCYLRTDGDIVYYKGVGAEDHKEGMLYDYSMEVGDSSWMVSQEANAIDSVLYVIDSISTVSCSGGMEDYEIMHVKYLAPPPNQEFTDYVSRWLRPIGDIYHPIPAAVCVDYSCEEEYSRQHIFLNGRWVDSRELTCEDLLSTVDYRDIVPSQLRLYPNPWRGGETLHLALPEERIKTVGVFEIGSGRQLFERTFVPSAKIATRLPHLRPGAYLVLVQTVKGAVMVEKMVVN